MFRACHRFKNVIFLLNKTIQNTKNINVVCLQKRFIQDSAPFPAWDIIGAMCVERRPTLTQKLSEPEQKAKKLLEQMELEQSLLSNHELQHLEDRMRAKRLKQGDSSAILGPAQTAQDLEDAAELELKAFTPASRITEADLANDQKSLERALDRPLLLVVKQKLGNADQWLLPQIPFHEDDEGLRQTADKALKNFCGSTLEVQVLGNCPCGFYKYKYPKAVRAGNNSIGAKVFFFKAHVLKGKVDESIGTDYRWLIRAELKDYLHPDYLKTLKHFLMPYNEDEFPEFY